MGRVIPAFSQFFDGNGDPVVNGWLQFLVSGSNNTPKNTYADKNYQIANANPLQLDAEGRCPDVFGLGDYRVISFLNDPEDEDSPGEQLQVFDPVTAQDTVSGGGGTGTIFDQWDPLVEYDLGDIVTRNLIYYRSLANLNLGNDPESSETTWERVDFLVWWNSTVFYETGNMVFYEDNLWFSLVNSNYNNPPPTSPAEWRRGATGYKGCVQQASDYTITLSDRDYIICLTPSAVADATFDLPAMSAVTAGFRLAVYNASDYTLTLDATGSAGIWLNTSGTLDIEGGAFVELIYHSPLDNWDVTGNVGPTLGNQDVGTVSFPIHNLYSDGVVTVPEIAVTTITIPSLSVPEIHLPSDAALYFGDADESSIYYDSVATALRLTVPAGEYMGFTIGGVDMWYASPTGEFLPGATNPLANIGSIAQPVNILFADYISLPTSGYAYFGDSDELAITYNGTISSLLSASSINIGTTVTATSIDWLINSVMLLTLYDGGLETTEDFTITKADPTITLFDTSGTGTGYTKIYIDDNGLFPSSNIDFNGSNLNILYDASLIFTMTFDGDATFSGNVTGASNHRIGWSTGYYLNYNPSRPGMEVYAGGSASWYFNAIGDFVPIGTRDVGTSTNEINRVYTNRIETSGLLALDFNGNDPIFLSSVAYNASNAVIYFTVGGSTYYISAPVL